jgi:hypothetical protein
MKLQATHIKPTCIILTALLLAPLAALHAKENSPGVPRLGILRADFFQALETSVSLASNDWN